MDFVELTESEININNVTDLIKSEKCGATSLFIGTTRADGDEIKVERLVYEAYDEMAIKKMKSVCQELRQKWPSIFNIAIVHRLGLVPVSHTSIVIAVNAPHRKDALEAVHYAIDIFKAIVPIWKKEEYTDKSESRWMENKECKWSYNS